jgi:hypothetical protein
MQQSSHRAATPAPTSSETWHHAGLEVFVIRTGAAPNGTRYVDGRHQIRVARFECAEDAKEAVERHNAALVRTETWAYGGFCG